MSSVVDPVVCDFDGDSDVDQGDFGHLQACFSDRGIVQNDPVCLDARLDRDPDVDGFDLALFTHCLSLSGPNRPAPAACVASGS